MNKECGFTCANMDASGACTVRCFYDPVCSKEYCAIWQECVCCTLSECCEKAEVKDEI